MEQSVYYQEVCKYLNGCSSTPVTLYQNNSVIAHYEIVRLPKDVDFAAKYFDVLYNTAQTISYKIDNKFLFGMVKSKTEDISIFVGPICILPIQEQEIKKMIFDYEIAFDESALLANYIHNAPIMPFQFALQILSFLNLVINKESLPNSAFVFQDADLPDHTENVYSDLQKHSELIAFDEIERHSSLEFENRMLYYIQNGQTENLIKLLEYAPIGRTGRTACDTVRQEKNNGICSITLCTRAAIAGGLNSETAFQLSDLAIQKIESCSSATEINNFIFKIITDLCERVNTLQKNPSSSPVVNRIIRYINEHISERLVVDELANLVHTNRSFLSNKFKAEIGIPLTKYINKQKVSEAKQLLAHTDKSLAAIANYLSFSSQSHFQNTFKKVTGLTPNDYRKAKKRE